MIMAHNIRKIYKGAGEENIVLDNLCFSAQKGEFCIVTGQSGCGKSTFLNVMSCLDSFDSGKLVINGKDIAHISPKELYAIRRTDISFVFQGYNLISSLTAIENVALSLKYQGVARAQRMERAYEALSAVGLSNRAEYMPHQMSGGQQQRVAIARALVTAPKILFCDEPTGNLDSESAALVLEKIKQLQDRGTLILMI
ncbi:MAG: ABC transporter ATP-binding protein, partial [Oscillospiraceae bacterium]